MPQRVIELHNIMPISNIPLVLHHGILSHEEASKLPHDSVALSEIQERRDIKRVPGGLKWTRPPASVSYASTSMC